MIRKVGCGRLLKIKMQVLLLWIDIGLIALAGGVFFQDLRERAVSLVLFIALFLLAGLKYFILGISYEALALNCLFIFTQLVVILLYCQFRYKEKNIFKFIGMGDLLCWGVLVWLFTPLNFVFFYIVSLVFSFMLFGLLKVIKGNLPFNTVPLAGFQSLLLGLVLGGGQLFSFWQPYDDFVLLRIINLV